MFNRRQLLIAGVAGLASSLSGCVTPKLFEPRVYREKVSSVLVSEDNQKLVIFTKDFHYIFDLPAELATVLKGSLHRHVKANIFQFQLDANGHITGNYRLLLSETASEEEKQTAYAIGFSRKNAQMDGTLSGMRYDANGVQPPATLQLNQEYEVAIREERSAGNKAGRALLTPVTVAADGVLVLAAVPLSILLFTVILIACSTSEHGCK